MLVAGGINPATAAEIARHYYPESKNHRCRSVSLLGI